jgi:hypothetical protein
LEENADLGGETVRCGKLAKTGASADQTRVQIPSPQPTQAAIGSVAGLRRNRRQDLDLRCSGYENGSENSR